MWTVFSSHVVSNSLLEISYVIIKIKLPLSDPEYNNDVIHKDTLLPMISIKNI